MNQNQNYLIHSFKEWAIAVSALATGDTIMLLRKGGIKEEKNKFQIKYQQFWLYPTYEHQKPQLLKSEYSSQVQVVESGWHPETIKIQSYAEITNILEIRDLVILEKLESYHIWNQQMVSDRFKWKPQQPLTILLLRVFNLATPVTISYHSSYGGCKSWIELEKQIALQNLTSALSSEVYQQKVQEIVAIINS